MIEYSHHLVRHTGMNLTGRLLLLLVLLAATITAEAQPRDRHDYRDRHDDRDRHNDRGRDRDGNSRRGPRIIVYQDAEFRGDSLVLYPGDTLENLAMLNFDGGSRLNDRISSIRVEGGAEVYVHVDSQFRGAVMRVTEDARDLTNRLLPGGVTASWNDRISSLRVEVRRRDEVRVNPDVVIKRAYLDLLEREPDANALRNYRSRMLDQGWTETMVRDDIRGSHEFRHEGADRIIQRAYRDVLGRDVDPSGLKSFRQKLLERNWTEDDVRTALRNSDEYKRSGRR